MLNRNRYKVTDSRYTRQQQIIKEVCNDLNIVAYYPDYHAKDRDCNTVLVYTKDDHNYNLSLEKSGEWRTETYKQPLFTFENTDINGMFSLDFANRGKIDLRGIKYDGIRTAITEALKQI